MVPGFIKKPRATEKDDNKTVEKTQAKNSISTLEISNSQRSSTAKAMVGRLKVRNCGLFVLSLFLSRTYSNAQALIFLKLLQICVEISLKIVYNRMGYFNQGGCVSIFCSA